MRCLLPICRAVLFAIIVFGVFCLFPSVDAHCMSDIRVGLVSQYKDKDVITIYNKRIAVGYCGKNSFKKSFDLYSKSGFSFEPDKGTYYISGKTYTSLESCKKAMDGSGSNMYPCLTGRDCWRVYIPSSVQVSDSLRESLSLSDKASSSSYLIRITYDSGVILNDSSSELEGKNLSSYPQIKAVFSSGSGNSASKISLGTRSYRGRMEIGRYSGNKLTAVNIVGIEAYLAGVVTNEMSTSYNMEALKAQAVCARSYAYVKGGFTCIGTLDNPYKLTDTTSSQVYRGYTGESAKARQAVKATKGEIIYSDGQPVEAFYFSTSGGSTESAIEVWGTKSSIYTKVFDQYELSPEKKPWVISYTYSEAEKLLKNAGYDVGSIESVTEEVVTSSGRVYKLKVTGSKGKASIDMNKAESLFSLPSSKYRVATQDTKRDVLYGITSASTAAVDMEDINLIYGNGKKAKVTADTDQLIAITEDNFYNIPYKLPDGRKIAFFGMGYGHGIGLSQAGAQGLAQNGYDYVDILKYYYKNIEIGEYNG